ncbi:MAG TPA: NAD-dependent epimerase/dehydratase family protein [Vicinamibacterales bacterium]|nr:NAD-dependent epimerase/dehydratase family protein [Vicinamibacterales bacterium]
MSGAGLVTVFGGTGFIGRHLVEALVNRGLRVRVVSRRRAPALPPRGDLSVVNADLADAASLRRAVEGSAVVFHLATGGGDTWADFAREAVDGTRLIAEACLDAQVQRLIYTSSSAALYLGARGTIDESAGTDPRPHRRSMYSRAKIEAERLLLRMHREHGLPVVILRPAVVLGSGGTAAHAGFGTWPSDLCCIGWGLGTHPLPLVLVGDVVSALLAAIDAPGIEGRSYNLAGDVRMSAREFVHLVAALSRRRYRFYPRPVLYLHAIDVIKWMLKLAARKPENPFPSLRDLRSNTLRTHIDCSAARRDLGWRPIADRQAFVAQAILPHVRPVPPGDLRLT